MLLVVLLAVIAAGVTVFLKPLKYLSSATAIPANSALSDKARIFNENIEGLYSSLGGSDDIDLVIGTGQLDTVYLAVTDQFNLFDHYKITGPGDLSRRKAALCLKKNTRIIKSDYRELKVKVWDTDKDLAPQLANALLNELQSIHKELQSESNTSTLESLIKGMQKLKDSIVHSDIRSDTSGRSILKNQLQKYQQLIAEYQLMVDSKPPALLVVENARPALCPDKPKRWEAIIAAAVLSFLFSFLLALVLEKRKTSQ